MSLQFDASQSFATRPPAKAEGQARPTGVPESAGRMLKELNRLARKSESAAQLLKGVADLLSRELKAIGAWMGIESRDPNTGAGKLQFLPMLDSTDNPLWPLLSECISNLAANAVNSDGLQTHNQSGLATIIALPILRPGQPGEVLVAAVPLNVPAAFASSIVSCAVSAIVQWRSDRMLEITGEHAQAAHRMLGLCRSAGSAESVESACIVVANQLCTVSGASQVAIAIGQNGQKPKLVAFSGVESFDKSSQLALLANDTIQSIKSFDRCIHWQAGQNELQVADVAGYAREIGASGAAAFVTCQPFGTTIAFLFGFTNPIADWEPQSKRIAQLSGIAASQLDLVAQVHASHFQRTKTRVINLMKQSVYRNLAIGAGLFVLMLLCPVPYRVACDARLEPVSRRFVAAPFDASLERTLAKNGDHVRQGDILALLDGRSLRIEQAGLEADLAAARKRHDSALATGDIADSQVAKNESKRAEAELSLIHQQLSQLEVRSPVSGIVVSGDLDTAEGITLTTGQNLFEIGPLDQIRAEILIPEAELRHVSDEAKVSVWLAAYPFQSWPGTIRKIHQRSEIVDDRNCFIAEVELANDSGRLRPGMKGQGRIQSSWRSLGWIWTHRAWERMRYLLVW